jgi:hypothetical protein
MLNSDAKRLKWAPGPFSGGYAAGAWNWLRTLSSADVKERVELYLYPRVPSWPVLRWTLPLPLQYYYVPQLPSDFADRKAWVIAAVKNIDAPMLTRVWQEPEYRVDVCRITRGVRIEHL